MKASQVMFFGYLTMMGVPLLLWLLAVTSTLGLNTLSYILSFFIAVGSVVYGAVGIREIYMHGRRQES